MLFLEKFILTTRTGFKVRTGFSDVFSDYKTFFSMAFLPEINNKRNMIF